MESYTFSLSIYSWICIKIQSLVEGELDEKIGYVILAVSKEMA